MAKALSRRQLLDYARESAQARIQQLRSELAALEAAFGGGRGRGRRGKAAPPAAAGTPNKRKMSAAGRKRIADAARKRWAKWRAEHGKR